LQGQALQLACPLSPVDCIQQPYALKRGSGVHRSYGSKYEQKRKEENDNDHIVTDEETICTVDEEDVEDCGISSEEEDNNTLRPAATVLHHKPSDDAPRTNTVWNSATFLPDSSVEDDSDADSGEFFNPPPEAKRIRLACDQDELEKLQSKYNQLILKSENFRKSAEYWKSRHNQSIQSKVAASDATRDNVVNMMLNDIVHSEDVFIAHNRK